MSDSAYVYQPGQAELRWMGETSTYFLATGEQTQGTFCLVEERASRGESVPLHRHPDDMESFYVLEGELTLYVGDEPGVLIPAGAFRRASRAGPHPVPHPTTRPPPRRYPEPRPTSGLVT